MTYCKTIDPIGQSAQSLPIYKNPKLFSDEKLSADIENSSNKTYVTLYIY